MTNTLFDLTPFFGNTRARKELWLSLKTAIGLVNIDSARLTKSNASTIDIIATHLSSLHELESFWAFPGKRLVQSIALLCDECNWHCAYELTSALARLVSTDSYRRLEWTSSPQLLEYKTVSELCDLIRQHRRDSPSTRSYFEFLVVDEFASENSNTLRRSHLETARPDDHFFYNVVVVSSIYDALYSVLLNHNIQSCVLRYSCPVHSKQATLPSLSYLCPLTSELSHSAHHSPAFSAVFLSETLRYIRPELDLFMLTESSMDEVVHTIHSFFDRCFFGSEDYPELRLTLLKGIQSRFNTPFFSALQSYSERPTGVFHALPISRSKSISKSHWISDYAQFYGDRIFLAETSATLGGLDSLLRPTGSILRAQQLASQAFGSQNTFFVTNGTSTANKIVIQAVTRPGDIILMAPDCHKSHHHAAILASVNTHVLDVSLNNKHHLCPPVTTATLKSALLQYKRHGQLSRVTLVCLSNLTFDGISYNLEDLITQCLAIKPDLIFLVDEAWFAYGYFYPTTRQRSAMCVATRLKLNFESSSYASKYARWLHNTGGLEGLSPQDTVDTAILPDPQSVKVRIYSTQSTHKTLTALRQASMIHVSDSCFGEQVKDSFMHSYQSHTSTSPNYQILASLDIARRQVHLEGYELVQKAFELAFALRSAILSCPILSKYYKILNLDDLLASPESKQQCITKASNAWTEFETSWSNDEFCLDPSRITIDVSRTGLSGESIKHILMSRYDIQVNKTSLTTILIIIHIGTTRGMLTYLIHCLRLLASELPNQVLISGRTITPSYSSTLPALPCFPPFHPSFSNKDSHLKDGNISEAVKVSAQPGTTIRHTPDNLLSQLHNGQTFVSASIVTPYPPGSPVLLPGSIITREVLLYLSHPSIPELHGADPDLGLLVFKPEILAGLD